MAEITTINLSDVIKNSRDVINTNFENLNEAIENLDVNTNDFIATEDGEFRLGAERFRYVGVNNYPLIQSNYTQAQLNSFFRSCVQDGIKVVRAWCFNKTVPATNIAGNFRYLNSGVLTWREATFVQLDMVLATARAYGVKMVLPLVDQWQGNKGDYVTWYNTINGTSLDTVTGDDFHTSATIKQYYKDYILKLTSRVNTINGLTYSEDPTIFSWELGNELRYVAGTDTNSNTLNSARLAVLTAWYSDMSTYIKSLDANHLVGTGSQAQYYDYVADDPAHNGTYYGGDYTTQHALTNIDYFDFHIYPYADSPTFGLKAYGKSLGYSGSTSEGFLAHINQYITIAKAAGKPVIIGEYGVDKRNTSVADAYLAYPRATHFTNILQDWFSRNGDGFTFWHYTNLFDDNNYNIKPDGVHVAPYANSNINDDDSSLSAAIEARQIYDGLPEGAIKSDLYRTIGDVVGPSSSTDKAIARFDGETGKLLQNSPTTMANSGAITLPNDIPLIFAGNGGNSNSIKNGSDNTFLVDTGNGNSIKVKVPTGKFFGIADGTFNYVLTVDETGKMDSRTDAIRIRTAKTPASASAPGNAGDICWDSSYIYVCVATNTWKRVAIATW